MCPENLYARLCELEGDGSTSRTKQPLGHAMPQSWGFMHLSNSWPAIRERSAQNFGKDCSGGPVKICPSKPHQLSCAVVSWVRGTMWRQTHLA